MNTASQGMLTHAWFVLAGLMLIFYVITDGFDLGVGILSLFQSERSRRDMMIQSIGATACAEKIRASDVVIGYSAFQTSRFSARRPAKTTATTRLG